MTDAEERLPGLLTRGDREFLQGKKGYQSPEAAFNKRRDIRRRILNGIFDFILIRRNLVGEDRRKIFHEAADDDEDKQEFELAVKSLLSWIYVGLKEGQFNAIRIFEAAIEAGEGDLGTAGSAKIVQTDVNINIKTREIESVSRTIEKLENGVPVDAYQLYPLVMNDVSIDLSEMEVVRVLASTGQNAGEQAVVDAIFSEYFDENIKVKIISKNKDDP